MDSEQGSGTHSESIAQPEKLDKVTSGQWIQIETWNRMVTSPVREQPRSTLVTTWTVDFSTRKGEGRRTIGD
jgi:hypothetical protein